MNRTNNTLQGLVLILLSITIAGCSSTGGPASKWLGHPESELITALGKPDNTANLENGRKILTWNYYDTPRQALPCSQSYTIGLDGNVEDFLTSNCAPPTPTQLSPHYRRGF